MKKIKKLILRSGQRLNDAQQSMVMAGGNAPCGCSGVQGLCLSSIDVFMPIYQWDWASGLGLLMVVPPSGISVESAKTAIDSGWARYKANCAAATPNGNVLGRNGKEHQLQECIEFSTAIGEDGNLIYRAAHKHLGSVFSD